MGQTVCVENLVVTINQTYLIPVETLSKTISRSVYRIQYFTKQIGGKRYYISLLSNSYFRVALRQECWAAAAGLSTLCPVC